MNDAQRRASTQNIFKKFQFPLDSKSTKYEAKIHFTAKEVESFDVNFLF